MTSDQRKHINKVIHDPQRSIRAPLVPQRLCQPTEVNAGLLTIHTDVQYSSVNNAVGASIPEASPSHMPLSLMEQMAQRRALQAIPSTAGKTQRKHRTCAKCANPDCPGRARSAYCKYPCNDCGKMNCRGRNSKRPNMNCSDGWD